MKIWTTQKVHVYLRQHEFSGLNKLLYMSHFELGNKWLLIDTNEFKATLIHKEFIFQ